MAGSAVAEAREALETLASALDAVAQVDFDGLNADGASAVIAGLERQARRVQAQQVELLGAVGASRAYSTDGHFSAKIMMRHHGQLSGSEAFQRDLVAQALSQLPEIEAAYLDGLIGTDQVRRIAAVWRNPRVRQLLSDTEAIFVTAAQSMEYPDFDGFCRDWEQTVDQDGTDAKNQRRWQQRSVKVVQDFNQLWDLRGRLTSADGAQLDDILHQLTGAERLADIETCQAQFGDDWRLHLRTPDQLRYDAFMKLVLRGAGAPPGTTNAAINTDLVIDQDRFEHTLAQMLGVEPDPLDPFEPGACHTASGVRIHGKEAVAKALTGHLRRLVFNAKGTTIQLGTRQRLFTGSARHAALIQALNCYWTACWVPAFDCQVDHLTPARDGGLTDPENGAPGCGNHNQTKEKGFHAWRDDNGQWHITRPDGTPVPSHTHHWPTPVWTEPDDDWNTAA